MLFSVAFSEKPSEEEAIREISLKTKSVLPRKIDLTLIFFTSHYKDYLIQNAINITLSPKNIIALEAPLLIYENKIADKGIVVICIESKDVQLETSFIKDGSSETIEVSLRKMAKRLKGYKTLISFLTPSMNPFNYQTGVNLALGKYVEVLGAGYRVKKKSSRIINNKINEGISCLVMGKNFSIQHKKIRGFLPLGKSFVFTKVDEGKKIILSINDKPAVDIYKNYLEDKFELFKKKQLFQLYPLGAKGKDTYNLLTVKRILGDESLEYFGIVHSGQKGRIMILNQEELKEDIKKTLTEIKKQMSPRLMLIFDSLIRRESLKKSDNEEKRKLKNIMGKDVKIAGFYCDYHMALNKNLNEFIIEEGNLHLTFWEK